MALMIKEIPVGLKSNLRFYRGYFTKPQFKHFEEFITGLIVSDNKTFQEINDCFNRTDQSSLNRFFTSSNWDWRAINDLRLAQIKKNMNLKRGMLIIDPTFLHKVGAHIEKVNYHYSGADKAKSLGHLLVDSFFSDGKNNFPVFADFYLRKEDADKDHCFRTLRDMCIEQIDYAIKKLPIGIISMDAGLYADFLLQYIRSKGLKYIIGMHANTKISLDRRERVSVDEYISTLTDDDFNKYVINNEIYFLHKKKISVRGIGSENLLVSYKLGDEENLKIYTTNILNNSEATLMSLLLKRWKIECLHRDTKQHLGLEDYQVRKFSAIQKVVCAVLVAYTQIILNVVQKMLEPLKRNLHTIGEGCRFFRLIAIKGIVWMREKAKNLKEFKKILNAQVFVKNAKV
jgi:SRSO17 transposase